MRDIWEKFRAALCISGGNRRTPPTFSPPDPAAAGDEGGAGEALSPTDLAPSGDEGGGGEGEKEDLLSALPDNLLLLVLLHLPSTAAAAQTCVLSRRWSRLWTQLPELWFPRPAEPDAARPSPVTACAALVRHEAPALRLLNVVANDANPTDVAAVLHLAAPRLTNELLFHNVMTKVREAGVSSAVEMPCFDRAERLILRLSYLGLVLPPCGVFRKLTMLDLAYVQFPDGCDIGDALSSARCPSLQQLRLVDTQEVSNLAICSESLLSLWLCWPHMDQGKARGRLPLLLN